MFGKNIWYGRIHYGKFFPSRKATPDILDFLNLFADDPQKAAAEYGKSTGCCCFCRRRLTEPRSLYAGYGPTCANNFGMAYLTVGEWKALPEAARRAYDLTDAGEAAADHTEGE